MNASQQAILHGMMRQKPNHQIGERKTPISVMVQCSCGWSTTVRRNQNALAWAQKIYSAKRQHLEESQ